jgi:hypothetical protein
MDRCLTCGYGPIMDPVVESTMRTPDEYWRVQIVRYGRRDRWYRVLHAETVVADRAPLATVHRILGDAMATLEPVNADEAGTA